MQDHLLGRRRDISVGRGLMSHKPSKLTVLKRPFLQQKVIPLKCDDNTVC